MNIRFRRPVWAAAIAASALAPGIGMPLHAQGSRVSGIVRVPDVGITGVVVYLVPAGGAPALLAPVSAEFDQRNLQFVPTIVVVTPGSSIVFRNSDAIMHNVFHPERHLAGFDLGTYPSREARSVTLSEEGAYLILCHVHPEMVAYVVVVASPYSTVTDEYGNFQVEDVAPGRYFVRTWHRRLKTHEQRLTIAARSSAVVDLPLTLGAPTEPRALLRTDRP